MKPLRHCPIVLLGVLGLAACSEKNTEEPRPSPGLYEPAPHGTIEGNVTYDGNLQGPLMLGAFTTFPPSDQPDGAVSAEPDVMWPATVRYEMKFVPPGEYYITAFIVVGLPHLRPAPTDPSGLYLDETGNFGTVKVVVGETVQADIVLNDPQGTGGEGGMGAGGGSGGAGGAAGGSAGSGGQAGAAGQ